MISPPPEKVIFVCAEKQPMYEEAIRELNSQGIEIEWVDGLPNLDELDRVTPKLIIYDDMAGSSADGQVANAFAVKSHHRNASVVYITQNLFQGKTSSRTINKNACYLILTKNVRDQSAIGFIARQMYPAGKGRFLVDVYKDATKNPYSYLFLNFRQEIDDKYRVMTGIFPDETTTVYLPK